MINEVFEFRSHCSDGTDVVSYVLAPSLQSARVWICKGLIGLGELKSFE